MSRKHQQDPELQVVLIAYPATVEGWMDYIAENEALARKMLVKIMQKQPKILRATTR